MRDLNYQVKTICDRNRDGSFSTRDNREHRLQQMCNRLHELGYRNLKAENLKPKHVEALVKSWKDEELSAGTIKNRMTDIRWLAEKLDIQHVVHARNDDYGIERRVYVTNESKAERLTDDVLGRVTDDCTRFSLRLQKDFGLRREEAIKFQPEWADRGDHITLKGSWTKSGQERDIIIRNDEQRALLDELKAFCGNGSLIPKDMTYVQQLHRFEHQTAQAGLSHTHGLRHAYAQERYKELTGREAPAAGGLTSKQLTREQKAQDAAARLQISEEMGHHRENITATYLGR